MRSPVGNNNAITNGNIKIKSACALKNSLGRKIEKKNRYSIERWDWLTKGVRKWVNILREA